MSELDLSFTGERFLPSCEREIWYEHYHRYTMAKLWVKDKFVLDAACGEGYGSYLLAQSAQSVVGVDISNDAIKHAKNAYKQANLDFQQADVLSLKFENNSFDVIVSFETLEHLAEHEQLLTEFKRVLKPNGVLLISTPDKKEYTDKTGFDNEYHVKELYKDEFDSLIKQSFKYNLWYGQKLMFNSTIWSLDKSIDSVQFDYMSQDNAVINKPLFNPLYFIVVASEAKLDANQHKDLYNFTEQSEQIYGHYNAVIRAHIKAEQDYESLNAKHQAWLKHPIIGRCIKWLGKE